MKVVLLAGGFGTRISEESHRIPKPMIEIGGMPILWHIMKQYSAHGYNDFIICCGYKQHVIKEFFADYFLHRSDITFDFADSGKMIVHNEHSEPWKVTVVDTGLHTMTGGRIKRVRDYLNNEPFLLTYGDGVSDVDINAVVDFHKKNGRIATITAIKLSQRFGVLDIDENNQIREFREKKEIDAGYINGGFMVLEQGIFDYIEGDATVFEKYPLETCAKLGELDAYKHNGFWQCMDTIRDKMLLEDLWESEKAPWKIW
ncbi:MAG TPA: glucose-1-phosphate cytidylyltransferase [Clostridiales bacterium]|jgi:glucose-1-phosphate cytidylyltransferase|nr:glucose-1-phosphate cytidylyltransferase [Clostridiales bacterium]